MDLTDLTDVMDEDPRIPEGAALLDEIKPGWESLIDLEDLVLMDPWRCILGQTFKAEAAVAGINTGYNYALGYSNDGELIAGPLASVRENPYDYGFCNGSAARAEWVELIKARRAAA